MMYFTCTITCVLLQLNGEVKGLSSPFTNPVLYVLVSSQITVVMVSICRRTEDHSSLLNITAAGIAGFASVAFENEAAKMIQICQPCICDANLQFWLSFSGNWLDMFYIL